jgi:DNA-binding response OmpR family regulator
MTARELALLEYLLRHKGDVVSKRDILEHVWDYDFEGDPNIVEVYIRRLRNKLDRPFDRQAIETMRVRDTASRRTGDDACGVGRVSSRRCGRERHS